jgi:hypothetical protein
MTIHSRWQPRAVALAALLVAATAAPAAAVGTKQIHHDTFHNTTSQHATEVEPDTFSHHGTTIAAMQVGRFFDGGASDIGWSRTTDGVSWTQGNLPGMTEQSTPPNNFFARASDASVAYSAAHHAWLISSIPLQVNTLNVPTVFVSRSTTDDGVSFDPPVTIPPPPVRKVDLDKNWTVCDNTGSQFDGRCYTEFDNFAEGDLEYMSTSTDGGATWSTPVFPAGRPKGLGGQPVVQPDGTVIVPFEALNGKIEAFSSTDGGQTWGDVAVLDKVT